MNNIFLKIFTSLFILSLFIIPTGVVLAADPTPTITSINPSTVNFGDEIEIIGRDFGDRAINNGIIIEQHTQKQVNAISWTDTKIRAVIGSAEYFNDTQNHLSNGFRVNIEWTSSDGVRNITESFFIKILPVTCTTWTYSAWSSCSSSGQQTRNAQNPLPIYCAGGNPILTQSCTYTPPVCSSWTYSDWSSCSSGGNQTRNVISSSPSSCTGGSPILTQSCTYHRPSCISFTYSDWGECKKVYGGGENEGYQNRDVTAKYPPDCQGGSTNLDSAIPQVTQLCTFTPPCSSDTWSCGDWNACSSSGSQTRTCNKTFDCSTANTLSPSTSQGCTPPPQPRPVTPPLVYQPSQPSCTADIWTCGDWNSCSLSGVQNRSCRKTFDCPNVETAPPITDQYCEAPNRPTQQVPQDSSAISNQDAIIKATVKLICPLDENRAIQGSGTVIDPSGVILTNKHVVSGTLGCLVGFINDFNDDPYFGDRQIADIQKVSSNEDVAILKLRNPQNRKLTYINVANSNSNFRLGTKVNIYGYPAKFGTNITYTSGDFSGTSGSYLKTTAIIEHGNSGGGAYFNDGNFIGVPTAVIKGELNALGYILSINTINAWLGNSSVAYNGSGNQNNYSRVSSILEDIDLKKLNSLELVIPGTKKSKEIINQATQNSPTGPPSVIKKTTPSKIQKESTIIQPIDTNQKINPEQSNPTPLVKEQKPNAPWIKRLFHWLTNLF